MLKNLRLARSVRLSAMLLTLGAAAACNDTIDVDDEPKVESFRVAAVKPGGQTETITVSSVGQSPATVNLPSGTTIDVEFLRGNGTVETIVNPVDFELRVLPVSTGVTFTRSGPFAGVLTASSAGTKTVTLQLYHRGENHEERSFPLTFTS